MLDYKTELGTFLTDALIIIRQSDKPIYYKELAQKAGVSLSMSQNILHSFVKRGLIIDNRGLWKEPDFDHNLIPSLGWTISGDGINYLENHRNWWKRFWVRSVICPLIVAFVVSLFTSIIAPPLWYSIEQWIDTTKQETLSPLPQDTEQGHPQK